MIDAILVAETIVPIAACIVLGYASRRTRILGDLSWESVEKLMFWVFLPCLIFRSIANGEFGLGDWAILALIFAAAQLLSGGLAFAHALLSGATPQTATSLFQNAVRWNNLIPIALISVMFGAEGLAIVAIALAVMVPIANVASILFMEHQLSGAGPGKASKTMVAVAKNPLIIACLAGGAFRLTGLEMLPVVDSTLGILAAATLGTGLLAVGAGIRLSQISAAPLTLATGTITKLILMPMLVWAGCVAAGIDGLPLLVAVICGGAPTAMQGYIVARNMGGDAELMGSLITVEHMLCILTIPLVAYLTLG